MANDYYKTLGIPRVINVSGTLTALGGSRMFPAAAEAMAYASQYFVNMFEVQEKVGARIAELLNVEAALVTAGAAAGLVQSAAACMAGCDPYLRSRLPDVAPAKREIIVMRSHRNPYDQALKTAGARLVEIGDAVRTQTWELEGSINENTAAILFVMQSEVLDASLTFSETLTSAHAFGVPVIVDAAAELPPKSNLWRLVHQGADLVLFSGGKDMRGPQTSGLIVGRKDLVQAAAYHSAPYHSVGRPMKASKEICIGLLAALECYLAEDEHHRFDVWKKQQERFLQSLGGVEELRVSSFEPVQPGIHPLHIPRVKISFTNQFPMSTEAFVELLKRGDPCIYVDRHKDVIILNMHTLLENEVDIVIDKIKSIISQSGQV